MAKILHLFLVGMEIGDITCHVPTTTRYAATLRHKTTDLQWMEVLFQKVGVVCSSMPTTRPMKALYMTQSHSLGTYTQCISCSADMDTILFN